ncbi:MAG: hypothetical protein M3413_09050 [Bacteroidota bacterium]|nr:hypothetical protein [Bacteroidota bacterium]
MRLYFYLLAALVVFVFTQCNTIKSIPTNTSGGLFSLNGNWQLITSSENRAMEGTIVTVVPGVDNATVRTLNNNTYCVRERDVLWRSIKPMESETFTIDNLINACQGNVIYRPATLTVLTNDEVRVTGTNTYSTELIQTWRRVASPQ